MGDISLIQWFASLAVLEYASKLSLCRERRTFLEAASYKAQNAAKNELSAASVLGQGRVIFPFNYQVFLALLVITICFYDTCFGR